jgi:acetyltransferase-like isoleucine patch superfamily enzyme
MKTVTWFGIGAVLVCTSCLGQPDDIGHVNSSISVDSNQEAGDLSDVNGAIRVGDHCTVRRSSTVNGGITIGSDSQTGSLSSVNGDLAIGSRTHVSGNAWTVNGHVDMSEAADVSGSLGNVNGSIHLAAAHVGNGISTVWGDIEIGKDSRVDNGIIVKKPSGHPMSHNPPPTIIVGPGATVTGTLRFEHEVRLYVSNRAKIGPVEGAQAQVYSGDRP